MTSDRMSLVNIVKSGRGGELVFFTSDYKFILKTVSISELNFIRKLTPEYEKESNNRLTYLAKIYGLFTIEGVGLRTAHIIIMDNISQSLRYPLLFDLKGS